MKTRLITISEGASVFDAAKKMKKEHVGSLLVQDSRGGICGILTDEDIVFKAVAENNMDYHVADLASKPLVGVSTDADIAEAATLMGRKDIKRLVVLSADKTIAGIISERDLVKIAPSLYDLIYQQIPQR